MKDHIQCNSSDKVTWYKSHVMTEEEKRKLIEQKINHAKQYLQAKAKTKVLVKS
jgi:hypothetical protein